MQILIIIIFCFLFFFNVECGGGGGAPCKYLCDDPVCNATCIPNIVIHSYPNCTLQCTNNYTISKINYCQRLDCKFVQPPGISFELEQCPMVEIQCNRPRCFYLPSNVQCDPICEAPPPAQWHCIKPINCPLPKCELQCEQPSCHDFTPSSSSNSLQQRQQEILTTFLVLIIVLMI